MVGLCTLSAIWSGKPPVPGQYLMAPRGRTAFLIVEVIGPSRPDTKHDFRLRCERRRPSELTPDDVVHSWRWHSR